jgi:hypothetical protein
MSFDLLSQLEASFDNKDVSIVEFAESDKYCGRVLYPRQRLLLKLFFLEDLDPEEERILEYWEAGGRKGTEVELSPGVRERVKWCKDNGYKHFREIVLVGGRRCSKGYVTALSMAKKMYDALQLQDPGKYYGIDEGKEICFSCVAASLDQAKDTQYADFSTMVNACGAMQRNIKKIQHLEFSVATETDLRMLESWKRQGRRVERDISKLRGKALPANSRTIRGTATMVFVFDEFAFFQQGDSDQSDQAVFSAAKPSLDQFNKAAMLFCNSSPYSKIGKFYERYEAGMAKKDNSDTPEFHNILSLRFPSWSLFEGWWEDPMYRGPRKCITVSPDWDPEEVKEDGSLFFGEEDRSAILIARQEERDDPEKYKVERRGRFAEVIDAYLIPEMVDRMFEGRPLGLDPITSEWRYERYKPNHDFSTYQNSYYAHLDPSSTTAGFGFALGHTETFELVDSKQEEHLVFDIIKRWDPKTFPNNTIDWEPILEWLVNLCEIFRPVQLSMDQFNSDYPITWLQREFRKRRIETRVFKKVPTTRTNWDRAEIFRTALNRGLIHAPHTSEGYDLWYASEELKYLQEVKSGQVPRVEKQDIGPIQTKDMADCMMEVVEATIGNTMATQLRRDLAEQPIRMGAAGGYNIGGPDRGGKGQVRPNPGNSNSRAQMQKLTERSITNMRRARSDSARPQRGGGSRRRGF